MREKLFHRDFTLVVIGQIISLLGMQAIQSLMRFFDFLT